MRPCPAPLILAVQINDGPGRAEDDLLEATLHHRRLPGQGDFDLVGYLGALREAGVVAPVGVEVFSDELHAARSRCRRPAGRRRHPTAPGPVDGATADDPVVPVTGGGPADDRGPVSSWWGPGSAASPTSARLRAAGFEVVAVVGRRAARTAERARLFEVPRACTLPGRGLGRHRGGGRDHRHVRP